MTEAPRISYRDRARDRWIRFTLVVLVGLGLAVAAFTELVGCPSRLLFGMPCPACGLTRATVALMTFHPVDSLRFHPLAAPLLAYAIVEGLRSARASRGRPDHAVLELLASPSVRVGLCVALLAVFALRRHGFLGGLPDDIDADHGLVGRALEALTTRIR